MEKISLSKTFLAFLKQHWKGILLLGVFAVVFSVIFLLYHLPVEAVLYAALICLIIGLICAGVEFYYYAVRHRRLMTMKRQIIYGLDELPEPRNLAEEDYTALLRIVHEDKIRLISEADAARSDMIEYYTLWAHQIKTPIAAMRLLLQSDESAENKELEAELFKIEQYVEMVLSYLRLDGGSNDFVLREYNLEPIVRQAVRKYAPLFIRKKISLELGSLPCRVLTDEKWLCFVIGQLLPNALKYTSKGKISIYMADETTLVIEDTGIGIAPEDLPRICEKGYTGYNGRTDKKATGIGLYLCKRILTKLSHTLTIRSEVGKGTTVLLGLDHLKLKTE